MQKKVLISIRGTQIPEGEEPQTIELRTDGTLSREDGALCLSYVESEMTGLEGVVTAFRVEDDRIILSRKGKVNSTMTFVAGESIDSLYDVGVGAMLLSVRTKTVRSTLTEDGGSFYIDYAVELEHVYVGTNVYEIDVRLPEQPEEESEKEENK